MNSASSSGSDADDSPGAPVGQGQIMARLKMDVWSEVIPPFNMMPREVLQVMISHEMLMRHLYN